MNLEIIETYKKYMDLSLKNPISNNLNQNEIENLNQAFYIPLLKYDRKTHAKVLDMFEMEKMSQAFIPGAILSFLEILKQNSYLKHKHPNFLEMGIRLF